jgi:hypothetical protein
MDKLAQVEVTFRKSEQCFQTVFDPIFEFIGLIESTCALIELNQTALDFGRLTDSEVISHSLCEAQWWKILKKTQVQLIRAIADDVLGVDDTIATSKFSIKSVNNQTGEVMLILECCGITVTDITLLQKVISVTNVIHLSRVSLLTNNYKYITKPNCSTLIKNRANSKPYVQIALSNKTQGQQKVHYCEEQMPCSFFNDLGTMPKYN